MPPDVMERIKPEDWIERGGRTTRLRQPAGRA
jgi:hypothetical protein